MRRDYRRRCGEQDDEARARVQTGSPERGNGHRRDATPAARRSAERPGRHGPAWRRRSIRYAGHRTWRARLRRDRPRSSRQRPLAGLGGNARTPSRRSETWRGRLARSPGRRRAPRCTARQRPGRRKDGRHVRRRARRGPGAPPKSANVSADSSNRTTRTRASGSGGFIGAIARPMIGDEPPRSGAGSCRSRPHARPPRSRESRRASAHEWQRTGARPAPGPR